MVPAVPLAIVVSTDGNVEVAEDGCKALFSEGGEVIKRRIQGSLIKPNTGYLNDCITFNMGVLNIAQALKPNWAVGVRQSFEATAAARRLPRARLGAVRCGGMTSTRTRVGLIHLCFVQ